MLELYSNIKKHRQRLNMSQQALAEAVGYKGKSMIAQVENGKVDLPASMITKFAEVFSCTENELLGDTPTATSEPNVIHTLAPLPSDISKEDQELLARYHNASPEDRAIVDLALKRSQQKS